MALEVLDAIKAAKDYLLKIYADDPPKELRVEEIERTEDNSAWLITLGYRAYGASAPSTIQLLHGPQRPLRDLKLIRVDAATGNVLAMKSRAA